MLKFKKGDRIRVEWPDHELNGYTGSVDGEDDHDAGMWWIELDNPYHECYYLPVCHLYLVKLTGSSQINCTCELSLLMAQGCKCGAFQEEQKAKEMA